MNSPVIFWRSPTGARETIAGKTCGDCCQLVDRVVHGRQGDGVRTECGILRGHIDRNTYACVLYPQVNGWQLLTNSVPSSEPPKPEDS
jgi:hypothetical protein